MLQKPVCFLATFALTFSAVLSTSSEENSSLQAIVIKPVSAGFNSKHIFNALARQPVVNNNTEGSATEDIEGSVETDNVVQPPHQIPELEGSAEVSDIEEEEIDEEENATSIFDPLETAEGVDENDPEEIARKEFYSHHKETFQQILIINNNAHPTEMMEGDIKVDEFRNVGGLKWKKTTSGVHRGLVRIPYKMSSKYNGTHRATIRDAMADYAKYTCIRFVPRRAEISYIFVSDAKGCWAYVGKTGYSAQTVSLGIPGCMSKGIVMHELMHAVGFQHEHSRSDRDKYVRILKDNIGSGEANFARIDSTTNMVIYDYNSIMHYGKNSFAKKPYLPSIQIKPLRKPEPRIGQRKRLSPYDIEEIKYLYQCEEGTYLRCGRDFIGRQRGSFESPSYPRAYPPKAHCTWKISVRPGKFVKITFQNVDIKDSPVCQDDAIHVHDGPNANSPVLQSICGRHRQDVEVTSTGRQLFVMFSTDSSKDTNTGFRAAFSEASIAGSPKPILTTPTLAPITQTVRQFSCDFDTGLCGMTQDTLDSIDWLHIRGPTPSRDTGPTEDHTTGRGQYIFVESSLPTIAGDNAIIRTPWFQRKFRFCVSFSYHMRGYYMGGLRLYAYEKRTGSNYGHEKLLWEKYGNQGRQWKTQELSYVPSANVEHVQFYWETFIFYYQSDCALDDITITPGNCGTSRMPITTTRPNINVWTSKTRPQPPTPSTSIRPISSTTSRTTTTERTTSAPVPVVSGVNCTFETDTCGFEQSTFDNFDWTRHYGETPSSSTGPSGDHTSGSGHYMYIEASSPRRPDHVAKLISPMLTPTRHCMTMWYHMYGKQTGKLSVTQIVNGISTILVKQLGDHGNQWNSVTVDLNSGNARKSIRTRADFVEDDSPPADEMAQFDGMRSVGSTIMQVSPNVQIIIEATRANGYAGDIAIDDIVITDSACSSTETSGETAMLDQLSCDFETVQGLCGIKQSEDDDFDWEPNSGHTTSSGTGPTFDNTKKNVDGVYMHIEASSPQQVDDIAELITPKFMPGRYCVRFASHMYGEDIGELRVFSVEESLDSSDLRPESQWSDNGNQGNEWQKQSFEFETQRSTSSVMFIFRGMVGSGFSGDIAIDDIEISSGNCPVTQTTTQQPTTTRTTVTTQSIITRISKATRRITTTTQQAKTTIQRLQTTAFASTSASTSTTRQTAIIRLPTSDYPAVFTCNFEDDALCGLSQMQSDDFDWIRHKGNTPSGLTGPVADHTTGLGGRGHYVFIEASSPQKKGDTAGLMTPKMALETSKRCITFWYHMWGSKTGDLRVVGNFHPSERAKKSSNGPSSTTSELYRRSGDQGERWNMARFEVNQNSDYYGGHAQFQFIAERGNSFQSDIAMDDLCIADGPCDASSQCNPSGVLRNVTSTSPPTKAKSRRPKIVTSSSATTTTTVARVRTTRPTTVVSSRSITSTTATTIRPAPSGSQRPPLWSGMPLCTFESNHRSANRVARPESIPGDSAGDFGEYVYPSHMRNGVMCGWRQIASPRDQFDWTRHTGATGSRNTGPRGDHTTKRGHYMYVEASSQKKNDIALLQTYAMPSYDYCMDINYHMYGTFVGRLSVRAFEKRGNGRFFSFLLRSFSGNKGNSWNNAKIEYSPRSPLTLQVSFQLQGIVGNNHLGDIAVDDITILPGRCDACRNPTKRFVNDLNQEQTFSTGCVHTQLFWVRCCSLNKEKAIYRRVTNCGPDMFSPERLNWYCSFL